MASDGRVILGSIGVFMGRELAIPWCSRIFLMYWDWESVVTPFEISWLSSIWRIHFAGPRSFISKWPLISDLEDSTNLRDLDEEKIIHVNSNNDQVTIDINTCKHTLVSYWDLVPQPNHDLVHLGVLFSQHLLKAIKSLPEPPDMSLRPILSWENLHIYLLL